MSAYAAWKEKAAGALVARLFAGPWRARLAISRSRARVVWYDFEPDPRIGVSIETRRDRRPLRRYHFADDGVIEVERLVPPLIGDEGAEFATIEDLALAVVEHDDARAWYRAGPAPRIAA